MITISDIFDALPASPVVAERLGITDRAVRAWRLPDRNKIPPRHWGGLVDLGKEYGITCLSWETLRQAHEAEAKADAA